MVYISAVITSIFDCKMLQSDLDGLILWSNEWAMKLNIDKCKILIVINKKNNYLSIKNRQFVVKTCPRQKYLGKIINSKLLWLPQAIMIRIMLNIRGTSCREISGHIIEKKIQCYKTYVSHVCIRIKTYVSIVKYVSAALDTKNNIEKVERVQRMAARFMIYDFNRGSIVTNMIKEFNLDFMELR